MQLGFVSCRLFRSVYMVFDSGKQNVSNNKLSRTALLYTSVRPGSRHELLLNVSESRLV